MQTVLNLWPQCAYSAGSLVTPSRLAVGKRLLKSTPAGPGACNIDLRLNYQALLSLKPLNWCVMQDVTVLVLLGAGVLSLVLGLAVEGGDSWIEGAAIMAAVAVVVLVTAVNNFQKEAQFRELNKLNEDIQVGSGF